jgi:hypothetical protein
MVTSLPTNSLHAEWLESGMQLKRVKVASGSETDFQYAAVTAFPQ